MPMPGLPIPLPPAAVPGTAENKVLTDATIRAIQAASEAVSNVYGRCAQALGRAWDRMFSGNGEGADGEQKRPELDSTGKVHGSIPDHVPEDAKPEQLNELKDDLKKSIETRKNEQNRLGEDGPHRERIRQEERLLRQIEKKLSGS
jgi:hypothetical protein